jgi:hypothetical protein
MGVKQGKKVTSSPTITVRPGQPFIRATKATVPYGSKTPTQTETTSTYIRSKAGNQRSRDAIQDASRESRRNEMERRRKERAERSAPKKKK